MLQVRGKITFRSIRVKMKLRPILAKSMPLQSDLGGCFVAPTASFLLDEETR